MKNNCSQIISLFGIGNLSKYQGSIASLVVGFIWYVFILFMQPDLITQLICVTIVIIISVISINGYMLNSEKNDPEEIVIDEACGIIISMLFINYVSSSSGFIDNFAHFFIALFIFRLLDGLKPSFIYRIQISNKPWAILTDDIIAGLITLAVVTSLRVNLVI